MERQFECLRQKTSPSLLGSPPFGKGRTGGISLNHKRFTNFQTFKLFFLSCKRDGKNAFPGTWNLELFLPLHHSMAEMSVLFLCQCFVMSNQKAMGACTPNTLYLFARNDGISAGEMPQISAQRLTT